MGLMKNYSVSRSGIES